MPNWCDNHLIIKGPDMDVLAFKQKAVGHAPWHEPKPEPNVLNFHNLVPIPGEVLKADYSSAGYDWELKHWGCKWGACHTDIVDEGEGYLGYRFDTAWSPPIAFVEHVSKEWPTLIFVLEYEESGIGFKGLARAQAGAIDDRCIDF